MPELPRSAHVDDGAVEEIARVYLQAARGDARAALRLAVTEALADLDREHRRLSERIRLVSRGYVRGRLGG